MERTVILSLSDGEREHLAAMGVTADSRGFLYSASGREVPAGVAVEMLSKAGISPSDFRRGPLTDGRAAHSAGQWTTGIPGSSGPMARTGPAGPPGPAGSGTGDRSMSGGPAGEDGDDDLVPGGDEDGEGVGPPDGMAKGMLPDRFMRPYLAAGHQADSPGTTGRRGTTAIPETASQVEPQDFDRGWIRPGHQEPPPDARPANNPQPPGSPGAGVYGAAAGVYQANQGQVRTEHLMPSQAVTSMPAPSRPPMLPADMRASAVPQAVQVQATRPAPGEASL
jgi:hypothetical protein